MSSLDDLLKEKGIFYLKERMNECGINTVGDLEYIIIDEEVSQSMAIKLVEKIKIKAIIKDVKSEEENKRNCKNDYNKSSSCSSVDETQIIYETINGQDENIKSETNHTTSKSTDEYEQPHPSNFPQLQSEMHNNNTGNPSQSMHPPQNSHQSSIYPDDKREQDSNSENEQLSQKMERPNSQYDTHECSNLDHDKSEMNSSQTNEFQDIGPEKKQTFLNKLKFSKSKTPKGNVETNSNQKAGTKEKSTQRKIYDIRKYAQPQTPVFPDSLPRTNPSNYQNINSEQNKMENLDFSSDEGKRTLNIITKFCDVSRSELIPKIILKDLILQDRIGYALKKKNFESYQQVKQYLSKFKESQEFMNIQTELTFENAELIQQFSFDDIRKVSKELNIVESVIEEKMLEYEMRENEKSHYSKKQVKSLLKLAKTFKKIKNITIEEYKRINIYSHKYYVEKLDKDLEAKCFEEVCQNIIPIAFHCMKCNLPFDDITDILKEKVEQGMPGSNHELFHLIFQHSTPIVKALCIDLYSFCSPVPFYYPLLTPINDSQTEPVFKLCHELWFTIPPCFAIASFGLGSASYLPIGKSELLNKIFNTDFTQRNLNDNHIDPFHFRSIDVQITKNIQLEGSIRSEEKIFTYFDCHGGAPIEIIKTLCTYVNMIIIHVLEKDIEHNRELFDREMKYFFNSSKIIVILVRDSNHKTEEERKGTHYFIYVPKFFNLSKGKALKNLKELFRKIIHSKTESSLTVDQSLIQKVLRDQKDEESITINDANSKITRMIEIIEDIRSGKSGFEGNDFLSFYPIFIEYMKSFYRVTRETDQYTLGQLNRNCESLMNQLSNTTCSPIISLFLDLFDDKYSSLMLHKLSKYFIKLNEKGSEKTLKYKYSIDILWREALLSFKHNDKMKDYNIVTVKLKECISKQIMEGEPFEIIDGDNLVFRSKDLDALLESYYEHQNHSDSVYNKGKKFPLSAAPTVISIFGPQSSGKSTLLNYCFGCKFITSAGRCTQGVYGSLFQMDEILNNSRNLLILDTEGLNSIESKTDAKINFDQTMALFCLAVSQIVIINVKGEIGSDLKRLLQVCAYSLNRLKVNKVNLPKIFLVLNQQADPNVAKYTGALKQLIDSLDSTFYTADSECVRISDLIKVSTNDLFVLPSAFNVNSIDDSPLCENDSSGALKLESTKTFADKCSVLRSTIFDAIRKRGSDKPPFESVSEWIHMAGHVWETCVKYQDIVMYRDLEEIAFSEQIRNISLRVIDEEIYRKKRSFEEALETVSNEVNDIQIYSDTMSILADKMGKFDETFKPCEDECKKKFDSEEKRLSLSGQFPIVYDQTISNLNRLIFIYRKNYEDKIKFQIKHILLEIKIRESMKSFQEKIEYRIDEYINFSQKARCGEFDKIWRECYEVESEDLKAVKNEHFENIYKNFKIECNFLEKHETILDLFVEKHFILDSIIREMERNILYGLKNPDIKNLEKCYFCILGQSHGDFSKVRPHNSRADYYYLSPNYFIKTKEIEKRHMFRKRNTIIIFPQWIPTECYPFVDSCSGDFNHYEISWGKCPEKSQILLLTSKLRNPNDPNNSCWDTLIYEVREQALTRLKSDSQLSQTTIKQLISDLYSSIKVVNHEIKCIRTMLSNQAERQLSTLLFSYAFREYWNYQSDQIKKDEARREEQKVGLRDYFIQKIDNRKMLKGEWDTKNMTTNDKNISEKFAMDYVESIKRYVLTNMNVEIEKSFEVLRESLTMEHLLIKANSKFKEEIERDLNTEVTDTNHFVIKFICERNTLLEKVFHRDWCDYQEKLKMKINQVTKEYFNCFVTQIIYQLDFLLSHFQKDRMNRSYFYSDYNFSLREPIDPTSVQAREAPFRAMAVYLSKYLDPMVPQEELSYLLNEFNVDGVKLGRSPKSILLMEKSDHALDKENFKRLENTNIFNELIFDIYFFITNFKNTLSRELVDFSSNTYLMTQFKRLENEYLKDALGCNSQCPSCGKFCERGIHNDGSKCQILTGHQFSSMGGKVWKNDEKRTAILFMCDDYKDHMTVKLPEESMKWSDFKLRCGNEWNWDLPKDTKLQEENKDLMKKIWTKFGRGILKYYSQKGTNISYVPLSLMDYYSQYYICFAIDGTASMDKEIEKARMSVSKIVNSYQEKGSRCFFRIVIYRDHCDKNIIETFPSDQNFTQDSGKAMDFLEKVNAKGGGDTPEAVLDGLATAVSRTNWKNYTNYRNIIVHIFDAPPHGNFPAYGVHRSDSNKKNCCCCNHSTLCPFDWESHVWQPMKKLNLFYHGISTGDNFPGYETTMKSKLGELCGEFQVCGKEEVDTAVVELFINFHM